MLELKHKIHHLHTRLLAIPFIDPFDLRYSNRDQGAEAVDRRP